MRTIAFKDLFIGQFFFDPQYGEDFIKRSETKAERAVSGEEFDFDPSDRD